MSDDVELDCFKSDIAFLKEEIAQKEKLLLHLTSAKAVISEQLNQLVECEKENKTECLLKNEIDRYNANCQLYNQELSNLQNNLTSLNDIIMSVNHSNNQHFVICQSMLVGEFLQYLQALFNYMKNIKDLQYLKEENVIDNVDTFFTSSEYINERQFIVLTGMAKTERDIMLLQADISGMDSAIDYIDKCNQKDDNWFNKVDKESNEKQNMLECHQHEIDDLCEKHVKRIFKKKQLDAVQDRKSKLESVIKKIEEFESIVKPMKLYSDCFLYILKCDWRWLKLIMVFLKDTFQCLQDVVDHCKRTKEQLHRLIVQQELSVGTCDTLLSLTLGELFCTTQYNQIEKLNLQVKNVNLSLASKEENVFKHVNDLISSTNDILNYTKSVDNYLHKGATRLPLVSPFLMPVLHKLKDNIKNFGASVQSLTKKYESFKMELEEDSSKKKLFHLWSDYLNNQFSVVEELVKLEHAVSKIMQ
ncbi:uncharacterized protein LOC106669816 isoform X2 [Cimex lectularius]|nr:uncharacterized protein LOC106669816 isoform X2 [Cimex lectularius]